MTEQDERSRQAKQQVESEAGEAPAVVVVAGDGSRPIVAPAPLRFAMLWVVLLLLVLGGVYLLMNWSGVAGPTAAPSHKLPMPSRQSVAGAAQALHSESLPPGEVETAPAGQPAGVLDLAPAVIAPTGPTGAEPVVTVSARHYWVQVGPFLSKTELATATGHLQALGFAAQISQGRGSVTMTRLLEGRYPEAAARQRLKQLSKTLGEAFILPEGDHWALYAGSFSDPARAIKAAAQLAEHGLEVTLVASELEKSGSLLTIELNDQATADQTAELINNTGYKTRIVSK